MTDICIFGTLQVMPCYMQPPTWYDVVEGKSCDAPYEHARTQKDHQHLVKVRRAWMQSNCINIYQLFLHF